MSFLCNYSRTKIPGEKRLLTFILMKSQTNLNVSMAKIYGCFFMFVFCFISGKPHSPMDASISDFGLCNPNRAPQVHRAPFFFFFLRTLVCVCVQRLSGSLTLDSSCRVIWKRGPKSQSCVTEWKRVDTRSRVYIKQAWLICWQPNSCFLSTHAAVSRSTEGRSGGIIPCLLITPFCFVFVLVFRVTRASLDPLGHRAPKVKR